MTNRFIQKLAEAGHEPAQHAVRIPLQREGEPFLLPEDVAAYILITPTHGAGSGAKNVPRRVVEFVKETHNRSRLIGVIGSGNENFGADYCAAAKTVASKLNIPLLDTFELAGTPDEVARIKTRLGTL